MAFLAPLLPALMTVSTGLGIFNTIKGMNRKDGNMQVTQPPAPLPTAPTQMDAATKAKEDLQKRRRISVLSGGDTDKTRGQALVSEANVGAKTLLGQ